MGKQKNLANRSRTNWKLGERTWGRKCFRQADMECGLRLADCFFKLFTKDISDTVLYSRKFHQVMSLKTVQPNLPMTDLLPKRFTFPLPCCLALAVEGGRFLFVTKQTIKLNYFPLTINRALYSRSLHGAD